MRLLARSSGLHVAGALVVFGYLQQVYPASRAFDTPWLNDIALLAVTLLLLTPVAWLWVAGEFNRSCRWALQGRAADPGERERVLEEPWRMAARPFTLWVVATTAIGVAMLVRSAYTPGEVLDLAQIMLIGGMAVSAISYLVIEQTYRPLFAFALAAEPAATPASLGVRPRLLLAWTVSSGVPLLGLALVPFRSSVTSVAAVAALAGIGLVSGMFTMRIAANAIAEPLDELRGALARVERGDLDSDLTVDDGGEVGQVQAGFNRMVTGLRERRQIADLFGRHVGQEVAEQALARGTDLGGESRRASVVFIDLIGSTAMAEELAPGEVVATLNAFFQGVVDTVQAEGGWVNKFEGDGALCVFGVPAFQSDHEQRALRAARALRGALADIARTHPGLDAGIGVSSGTVVAGNVGTEERFEYTVIGRPVNEAARLSDLAKQRSGRVLASGAAVQAGGPERARWTDRGRVDLRGQKAPTVIHEPTVSGTDTPAPIHHIAVRDEWEAAQAAGEYRRSTLGRSLEDVGYIHCSTTEVWPATLSRFYGECTEPLVLLTIDPALVEAEILVEGGFPHIYGPLPVTAVTDVEPIR